MQFNLQNTKAARTVKLVNKIVKKNENRIREECFILCSQHLFQMVCFSPYVPYVDDLDGAKQTFCLRNRISSFSGFQAVGI